MEELWNTISRDRDKIRYHQGQKATALTASMLQMEYNRRPMG